MDETSSTSDHRLAAVNVRAHPLDRLSAMDSFVLIGTALATCVIAGMLIVSTAGGLPRHGFVAGVITFLLAVAAVRLATTPLAQRRRRVF